MTKTQEKWNKELFTAIGERDYHGIVGAMEGGASVLAKNEKRETPLDVLAQEGGQGYCEEIVKRFILKGADLEARSCHRTPLQTAIMFSRTQMVEILLSVGASLEVMSADKTVLHLAASDGCEETIRILLEAGAARYVCAVDRVGATPLHYAASQPHAGGARLLLEAGADVNALDNRGRTPLFYISEKYISAKYCPEDFYGKTIGVLVAAGADAGAGAVARVQGNTALHHAARRGDEEVARLLLKSGADVNALDGGGATPLHLAVQEGHEGVVRILVEEGEADVSAENGDGDTPLQLVLGALGGYGMMRILVAAGGDMVGALAEGANWTGCGKRYELKAFPAGNVTQGATEETSADPSVEEVVRSIREIGSEETKRVLTENWEEPVVVELLRKAREVINANEPGAAPAGPGGEGDGAELVGPDGSAPPSGSGEVSSGAGAVKISDVDDSPQLDEEQPQTHNATSITDVSHNENLLIQFENPFDKYGKDGSSVVNEVKEGIDEGEGEDEDYYRFYGTAVRTAPPLEERESQVEKLMKEMGSDKLSLLNSEGNLKEQETSSTEFRDVDIKCFVPGDHNNQVEGESIVPQELSSYKVASMAALSAAMLLGAVVHSMHDVMHHEHGQLVGCGGSFY